MKKFIEIAEANGWSVYQDGNELELSQYSEAGQAFSFSVEGDDFAELKSAVASYHLGMNADEMAQPWIGEDGHGGNGAPYHIKDLVEDMEQCIAMVWQLLRALNGLN